ncbi:MAG TPA: MraY family glycosyltransferase, partial [Bacillales bacterium]|nr:MraY family glycosyltransferase [Bacillales bacterium]
MYPFHIYAVAFGIAMIVTILTIPFVTQVALHFHFVDTPNERKVHTKKMPRLGGIAIILGFTAGFLFLQPDSPYIPAFLAGGIIIATAGILDDKFSLTPWVKLAAQTLAALVFVSFGPVIDFVNIPFIGYYEFGWISYPLTILWLVTVTNAINLIDGLDGLA